MFALFAGVFWVNLGHIFQHTLSQLQDRNRFSKGLIFEFLENDFRIAGQNTVKLENLKASKYLSNVAPILVAALCSILDHFGIFWY